ncbi:RNA polymerase sigma factor region1.1 domain-containing protein [Bradyrhizobium stylosanthis]|uniref:Sigma-70-like protein n=1 Tax=Bradyrhizobium stylosanthis TaxID=1803665 RepID=A0A560EB16_9BRAD|nr:RNA polymerase sigma factor region1.1 domain-containing protein [Bradyrhizobium stylosanthis]TWB06550.1 sigma-70-like protein [Bradyrhizobium stylosanthis]
MDWSEVVRKAVILAEKTGYVTFDQLNELMPSDEAEPEDIEALLTALSDRDIRIEED